MHGKVIAEEVAGWADESRQIPNQPDSLFRIGSLSKSFAAAAVLSLEEDGLLLTSAPARTYLPEYPAENLQHKGKTVTVHHLLRHTSGLAPYELVLPLAVQASPMPLPAQMLTRYLMQHSLASEPGREYRYNNANYDLLGLIIERVSHLSFERFVRERLSPRLGVRHIGAVATAIERKSIARGSYPIGPFWLDIGAAFGVDSYQLPPSSASGSLFASSRELHLAFRGLVNGKAFNKGSSTERLLTPGLSEYGYGVVIDSFKGWKRVSHGGSVVGSASQVDYFPELDAAIVVLSNGDGLGVSMSGLLTDLRHLLRGAPEGKTSLRAPSLSREVSKLAGGGLLFLLSGRPVSLACLGCALLGCLWTAGRRRGSMLSAVGAAVGGLTGVVVILELAGASPPILFAMAAVAGMFAGVGLRRAMGEAGAPLGAPVTFTTRILRGAQKALELTLTVVTLVLLVTCLAMRDQGALASACAGVAGGALIPRSYLEQWATGVRRTVARLRIAKSTGSS